jgi:hypothetical protein
MKRMLFIRSYDKVEMRGVYGSIDSYNIAEFGYFNFCSHLTSLNESLLIRKRFNMRALVTTLHAGNVLGPRAAQVHIQKWAVEL